MSSQYIVSLLAQRPSEELRDTVAKVEEEIARLQIEADQMRQALRLQAQQARRTTRPARRGSGSGDTRSQVLDAVRHASPNSITPAAVVAAVKAEGSSVTKGAIRNMLRRLVDDGEVERVSEGIYRLPSRNGSSPESNTGSPENEAEEPLLTAVRPQEGT